MANEIEVAVTPGGRPGEYQVRVIRAASGGEPHESLHLDVPRLLRMRPALESAVLASAAHARGGPVPELERPLRDVGQQLFEGLFAGAVRETYRASVAVARERGAKLRVVLHLEAAELSALPWEAMWDPEAGAYLCRKEPLVRHVPAAYTPDPLPVTPPIRVLCLVASPRGLAPLDVERERTHLEEALRVDEAGARIHLEWLVGASWDALQDRLLTGTWHVLHFIGHGDYDPVLDQGRIALVGEDDGRADWVEAGRLVDLLNEADPTPRLVVLNSCSSGQSGTQDVLSGTAAALVGGGISAVAAMQFRVSDPAAVAFPRGFYKALAAGKGVDVALSSGRVAILGRGESLEWVTPVLYVRGGVSQLFALGPPSPTGHEPVAAVTRARPAAGAGEAVIGTGPASTALPSEVTDDPRYPRATAAYWRGDWDDAVSLLEQLHAEHPTADLPELARARRKRELAAWWAQGGQAAPAATGAQGSGAVRGSSTDPTAPGGEGGTTPSEPGGHRDTAAGAPGGHGAGGGTTPSEPGGHRDTAAGAPGGHGVGPEPPAPPVPGGTGPEQPPRRPSGRRGAVIAVAVLLLVLGVGGVLLLSPGGDGEPDGPGAPPTSSEPASPSRPTDDRTTPASPTRPTDEPTTPTAVRPNLKAYTLGSEKAELGVGEVKDFTVRVNNDRKARWTVGPSARGTLAVTAEGAQVEITRGRAKDPPAAGCSAPTTSRGRSTIECAFDRLEPGDLAEFSITLRGAQAGQVDVSTYPAAAGTRGLGDSRRFTVTDDRCVVPDVIGWPVADAADRLRAAGLVPQRTEQPSDASPGQVISADPPAGTRVECGTTVELVHAPAAATTSPEPSATP